MQYRKQESSKHITKYNQIFAIFLNKNIILIII